METAKLAESWDKLHKYEIGKGPNTKMLMVAFPNDKFNNKNHAIL